MRNYLPASLISVVLAIGQVPATAQSARDIMNIFGTIVQTTMVQATQAQWRKLPPSELSCVEDNLRQRGISLQALTMNGIPPSDPRMTGVVGACKFQANLQQPPTVPFQLPAEPPRTANQASKYTIDKIPLGGYISFDSTDYRGYQCRPSEQFSGFTWCQKRRTERNSRGAYLSSYSALHTTDGRVYYLNRFLEPAFFSPGEVGSDIERLTRKHGEQPRIIQMPQRNTATGVIAYWGSVVLAPLDAKEAATLASGHSPGGILIDFSGDFQESIRQALPVYKVTGGPGFVWAESHEADGRGRLRFFEIDPTALSSPPAPSSDGSPSVPPVPASDPWRDCQSPDAETRLSGCTKVIDARGSDRIRLADAFDGRCSAYNQRQQFQPALSDCKSAIDLNPRYSFAYANLGAAYLGLNDPSSALSALNKAIEIKTNFLWSRLSRAKALEDSGSGDDALRDYEYALLIDPLNQQARDGVIRLTVPAATMQTSEYCVRDTNEQAQTVALAGSAKGNEGAISIISSSVQVYKSKLESLRIRIDDLNRGKDAVENRQAAISGSTEERKRALNEVQQLSEAVGGSQTKVVSISREVDEMEAKLAAAETDSASHPKERQERIKELRRQILKLRSARADAENDLHQKISERDAAAAKVRQKALQISLALADVQKAVLARDAAESCATTIRANLEALDQKIGELQRTRDAEIARTLEVNASNLMSDLSEFAQHNSNLVPLEVGPLVAALKEALASKDVERSSKAYAVLLARLDEVPEFKSFRTAKQEARDQSARAELDQLVDTARTISDFTESYVRRNITADTTLDLLQIRNAVSGALITPEAQALRGTIAKSEAEFESLRVSADYRDYRAKHPKSSKRALPETTDKNRPLVEGPLDETLILVNESGRAGVIRNLRGDLVFDGGKATLCFPHENSLDAVAMAEIKLKVREKGARSIRVSSALCTAANVGEFDTIAVNRGLFETISPDTATALLNAVDRGELSIMASISDRDLQNKRNGEGIKSLQIENDILKKAIEGYGLVAIANGTSVICQTSSDRPKAHESLVSRSFDRLQVEFGASQTVISTSIDSAFVAAKRGQCGAIYGSSKELKDLITSLQRDKLNYHVLPIWFTASDVDAEQNAVAATEAKELRDQQEFAQKKKDDELRAEIEKNQTDAERRQRQDRLRNENGAPARSLEQAISAELKAFAAMSENDDKTHVRQEWPVLATWYRDKIREQWELENIGSELQDYGVVEWKNRILEAGFVTVTFNMKHRLLGEHQKKCFIVGYVADREFEVKRDPVAGTCDSDDTMNKYKIAHGFSSKWYAN